MNYYEHHLGDYAEATAHLSFVEDAAYSRLIRKYYSNEQPLPAEIKSVQRLVGARTKDEREAVATVLKEFFELRADGWHNDRCDEEIARYQDKRAKAKGSANARWKNQNPSGSGDANASENGCERIADAVPTQYEGNALQSPVSNPQSPDTSKKQDRAHALAEARSVQGLNVEAFDRWVQYRAERKPAIKTTSIQAAAEELVRFGTEAQQAEVVTHSIANGYQGLFARKVNGTHGPAPQSQPLTKFERLTAGLKGGNSVTEF